MIPFGALFATQATGATLTYVGNSGATTLGSLGVRAGDMLFLLQQALPPQNGASPSSGSGAAWSNYGQGGQGATIWGKRAVSADISARVNSTDGGAFTLVVYTNNAGLTSKGVINGTQGIARVGIAGFKKAQTHAGLIIITRSQGTANSTTPDQPSAWVKRAGASATSGGGAVGIFDRLYPANQLYVDNTDFGAPSQGTDTSMSVYELTR
jgi:hypothetical protein